MFTKADAETYRAFWESFSREPLYETGFADAVQNCGASRADTWERPFDVIAALAYLTGYAQACRLANSYMSRGWRVSNLLACAAGIQLSLAQAIDDNDPTGRSREAAKLCETWTREITHELTLQGIQQVAS